jgi:hypothetical protein
MITIARESCKGVSALCRVLLGQQVDTPLITTTIF